MTAASGPHTHRVIAVIAPGDGPHLLWPPLASGRRRARPATRRLSLADDLARCLRMLDEDPGRFEIAAAAWHARWCIDLATLTLTDAQTALTALQAIAGPAGADAAGVLRYLCKLHDQRGTAEVLDRWIAEREHAAASEN
jgi:hypothetical protein